MGPLRIDTLADVGANAYANVGRGFFSDDPGAGDILPFAGARLAVLGCVHTTERARLWIGLSAAYAEDMYMRTHEYNYHSQGTDWFSAGHHDEQRTSSVDIGQSRISVLATTGVTLPF